MGISDFDISKNMTISFVIFIILWAFICPAHPFDIRKYLKHFFYKIKFRIFLSDARDLLRQWREENVRKSRDVVHLWEHVLVHKEHKLGDESKYHVLHFFLIYIYSINYL